MSELTPERRVELAEEIKKQEESNLFWLILGMMATILTTPIIGLIFGRKLYV